MSVAGSMDGRRRQIPIELANLEIRGGSLSFRLVEGRRLEIEAVDRPLMVLGLSAPLSGYATMRSDLTLQPGDLHIEIGDAGLLFRSDSDDRHRKAVLQVICDAWGVVVAEHAASIHAARHDGADDMILNRMQYRDGMLTCSVDMSREDISRSACRSLADEANRLIETLDAGLRASDQHLLDRPGYVVVKAGAPVAKTDFASTSSKGWISRYVHDRFGNATHLAETTGGSVCRVRISGDDVLLCTWRGYEGGMASEGASWPDGLTAEAA